MSIAKIEEAVQEVVNKCCPENFIYELLGAYGKPKASITRLQKGNLNLSKLPGEVIWKKNLLFRAVEHRPAPVLAAGVREAVAAEYDLHILTDQLRKSTDVTKHGLRFVVVTDYQTLLAVDTKTAETLDIPLKDLAKHVHFFLPWAGQEKHRTHNESQADVKAAYRMAKLYDQICKDNSEIDSASRHSLNVFLSRILFCFFAEDTEIFPVEGMFTDSIASHTADDGSDLDEYLDRLFEAMNKLDRSQYPEFIRKFPYVNGGLFANKIKAPKFSRHSRKILIECGELDWSEINPDIFGSMIQAVVHPDQRSETGMHYTSVTNIMKVLDPLLLRELRTAFEENYENVKGLERLRTRLSNIKLFDPACGSGNFLIIAFKELRKLEMEIFQRLRDLNPSYQTLFTLPQIQLTQCFGIEIDDFAHEIAILSLWLAEHQMNVKFKEALRIEVPALPLKESGHIVCDNATAIDWDKVCPKDDKSEIFVLGNPPYSGSRTQNKQQKEDMLRVFKGFASYKDLDYISCWFIKGSNYIEDGKAKLAFVSTNSICQGTQVALLWPYIFRKDIEISFAYEPFTWQNNAKHNAGVTVSIIGLRKRNTDPKFIIDGNKVSRVENINGYLSNAKNIAVQRISAPISKLPKIYFGSMANDGGNLILTRSEADELIEKHPASRAFIRRFIGAHEFIHGNERWCLKIADDQVEEAMGIPDIKRRLERVADGRSKSTEKSTRALAQYPHRFYFSAHLDDATSILVPCHTSERREYAPVGFLDGGTVILNSALAIYNPEPWIFAVISSKLHNVWVRAVGGRIRTDIRYSVGLCYNTFPIPDLTAAQKEIIATHGFNILVEREKHPEKTLAELYDPEKMPENLLLAHRDLDAAVERCYRSKPFTSDNERLEYLFKLYEEMLKNADGTQIQDDGDDD